MKPYTVPAMFSIATSVLLISVFVLFASTAFPQTAVLTPQGNYLCNPMGFVTSCAGPDSGVSILQLGPQTFTVTPMTPTYPQYPALDEPKQPRESSTPFLFSPSQGNYGSRFEPESPKRDPYCLDLFGAC